MIFFKAAFKDIHDHGDPLPLNHQVGTSDSTEEQDEQQEHRDRVHEFNISEERKICGHGYSLIGHQVAASLAIRTPTSLMRQESRDKLGTEGRPQPNYNEPNLI